MTWVILSGMLFLAVGVLCWALMQRQRTDLDYLTDERDWGAQ